MSNILIICGLPGSGKTTLANQINKENDNKYRIIDDPNNFDTDINPYIGEDLIITDPHLCFENNQIKCEKLIKSINNDVKIDWIFFENNPDKCIRNANRRGAKKVDSFIKNYSSKYYIPKNSNVIEIS